MGMLEVGGTIIRTQHDYPNTGGHMAAWVETTEDVESRLSAGIKTKGEYRCAGCGYGVTIYRELPQCPMCGSDSWEEQPWSPFTDRGNPGFPR
jgi:lipopolysaccharide biosynthesis regulator YciM